ncbi:MAG: nitroreductase family protein [Candidatus Nanopelagicales bacterium]
MSTATTTPAALHPLLAERRSTRAYDASPVHDDALHALLEAARWAPSARNDQPWRFLVGRLGDPTHAAIVDTLGGGNRAWAGAAPLLVAALVRVREDDGSERAVGPYELGLAVAQLSLQAAALDLSVHQIGGFDADALAAVFDVPEGYRAFTVLAIGREGDASGLPEWARARERAPRTRLPLAEIAFAGRYGVPLDLDGDAADAA